MMLCAVIRGPSWEEIEGQLMRAREYADLVELRIDGFSSLDLPSLRFLSDRRPLPMIFTLRSKRQGGAYEGSEEDRLADLYACSGLKPDYLDIESDSPPLLVDALIAAHPKIQIILSWHDFRGIPADLDTLYSVMKTRPACYYKIAVTPNSPLDTLHFLCWASRRGEGKLIATPMGSHGRVGRLLGPMIGSPITYAALKEEEGGAVGQWPVKVMRERFHHHVMSQKTPLYGLIGDPIEGSRSDLIHNELFFACGWDAFYIKVPVRVTELSEFLSLARRLPFRGLSVTMPLKEVILPHLDWIDPIALAMGSVNTLLLEEGRISGFNTDGKGALCALEKTGSVKGKRIVILGAGGAARAIAHEACSRGGFVTILNRDKDKSVRLAERLHCVGMGLEQMLLCTRAGYDILINCTPLSLPIAPESLLPGKIVMDIVRRPKNTVFLQCALEKGCRVIYGDEMFIEQAMGQYELWFGSIDFITVRNRLEKAIMSQ